MNQDHPTNESRGQMSEAEARRIIARAIELDVELGDFTTLARVREIAKDAGISELALSRAISEPYAPAGQDSAARPSRWQCFQRRFQASYQASASDQEPIVPNLFAGASFFLGTTMLAQVGHLFGTLGVEASIVVSSLVAAFIARTTRARLATLAFFGFAACQVAELLMHATYGVDSVQGGPTHWAVMIAGLLGVAIGSRFAASGRAPTLSNEQDLARNPETSATREQIDRNASSLFRSIRLRLISGVSA